MSGPVVAKLGRQADSIMRQAFVLSALNLLALTAPTAARDALPAGFVYLREVDASIVQDMRYASHDNFVGHPLPGYAAGECVLRQAVAEALAKVQAELAQQQLSLKVYDCYRPRSAVAAMMRWSEDGARGEPSKRFFPTLHKRTLFVQGYIAAQSVHSTGAAIDLTLIRLPAAAVAAFDPAVPYGSCTGPASARAPDNSMDMGTGFDCFDVKSYTLSRAISPEQRRWRSVLVGAMRHHGFKNYFREWWHFTYGARGPSQDFPIGARR